MSHKKQSVLAALLVLVMLVMTLMSACGTVSDKQNNSNETQMSTEATEDNKSYTIEDFSCKNGDKAVLGKIYTPKNKTGKLPTVIVSHGYNNNLTNMQMYSTYLAENGFLVIAFDFCGGAASSTSDGKTTEMSIFTEEDDLKAVVDAACRMEAVDTDRIYLLGASQGGMVSAMAAADLGDKIDGLVLIYPAFSIADDARELYASEADVPETVAFMSMQIGRIYYEDLFDYDPFTDVVRYTDDVLILHGTADQIVPYDYAVKASDSYQAAELVTIQDAVHGFYKESLDSALEHIMEYLNKKISE